MFASLLNPVPERELVFDREEIVRREPSLETALNRLNDRQLRALPRKGDRSREENAILTTVMTISSVRRANRILGNFQPKT